MPVTRDELWDTANKLNELRMRASFATNDSDRKVIVKMAANVAEEAYGRLRSALMQEVVGPIVEPKPKVDVSAVGELYPDTES